MLGLNVDALLARLGSRIPEARLRPLLRAWLRDWRVALCLHRVAEARRASDLEPQLTITPQTLDALLELLLSARPDDERWLSVAFDDGYADAARYVESRAERFAQVEFLFFVCPEKSERQAGFRWDLAERRAAAGDAAARDAMSDPFEPGAENERPDLRELGRRPEFALADPDALRALGRLPNVTLGNHTDGHQQATRLPLAQVREEYRRSHASFERLFGPQTQFAFPFGTPGEDFDERHVAALRELGDFLIWSTESRPYAASERRPGAVLPRYAVDGTWSPASIAFWIAARAALHRVRGSRHGYTAAPR